MVGWLGVALAGAPATARVEIGASVGGPIGGIDLRVRLVDGLALRLGASGGLTWSGAVDWGLEPYAGLDLASRPACGPIGCFGPYIAAGPFAQLAGDGVAEPARAGLWTDGGVRWRPRADGRFAAQFGFVAAVGQRSEVGPAVGAHWMLGTKR